ncbi:hypothetical protein [Dactylosporangium salmoneum]|uniref:Lipoprotein n=1 Tax=Dactylosporangium salmoneum TaxID=53361 RepID=A0ABP5V6H6_9ACTN
MSRTGTRHTGVRPGIVFPVALALITLLVGCASAAKPGRSVAHGDDPGAIIEAHTAQVSADGPYRDPTSDERARGRDAIRKLLAHPDDEAGQDAAFGKLGYTTAHGVDPITNRRYSMFSMSPTSAPAWGILLVDRSAPPRVVFEVPHPGFDINTDDLGVSLYHLVPGSVLLVAGQHRLAGGGAADVAHNDKSMFHAMATEFAKGGLGQVQLHGFADKNLPDAQVVVSTGVGQVTKAAKDIADGLKAGGLIVCRAWATTCGRLEGTSNEQGKAADEIGAQFLHLELGWVVRRDPQLRDVVARVVAGHLPIS